MNKNITTGVIAILAIIIGLYFAIHSSYQKTNNNMMMDDEMGMMGSSSMPMDETMPMNNEMGSSTMMNESMDSHASDMMNTMGTGKVVTIDIAANNFNFTPNTITVNKGDTVKIVLHDNGGFHDFKIDEFNVATPRVNSGQTSTVEFVADKTGTFEYYCSVGNHRQMGMKGTLTVK